jgi:hypothetical protein
MHALHRSCCARLSALYKKPEEYQLIEKLTGADLVGKTCAHICTGTGLTSAASAPKCRN